MDESCGVDVDGGGVWLVVERIDWSTIVPSGVRAGPGCACGGVGGGACVVTVTSVIGLVLGCLLSHHGDVFVRAVGGDIGEDGEAYVLFTAVECGDVCCAGSEGRVEDGAAE